MFFSYWLLPSGGVSRPIHSFAHCTQGGCQPTDCKKVHLLDLRLWNRYKFLSYDTFVGLKSTFLLLRPTKVSLLLKMPHNHEIPIGKLVLIWCQSLKSWIWDLLKSVIWHPLFLTTMMTSGLSTDRLQKRLYFGFKTLKLK